MNSIKSVLLSGENKRIEFKQDYSRSFLKTVTAFANYNTGRILFGVDDKGNIIGVNEPERMRLAIENTINDNIFPKLYFEISTHRISERNIIELVVYKGEQTPYTFNNKAYKRSDTATIEVDRIGYEELILEGRNLSLESLPAGKQELTFNYLANSLVQKLKIAHLDYNILTTLELYQNGKYNQAAALFSDQNPIQTSSVSMIKYEGAGTSIISERIRLLNRSVLEQFQIGIDFFKKYLPVKEIIDSEVRRTVEKVPLIAYREALANALVHRDYSRQGEIRIEINDNGVEIVSPGGLPGGISENEYLEGRISVPRNRILTEIFFRLGLIEKLATGIRRIKEQYQGFSEAPSFSIMENSIKVTLPLLRDKLSWKADSVKETASDYGLSQNQSKLLEYLRLNQSISRMEAQAVIGLGKTQTYETINYLIEKNLIMQVDKGRAARYILVE